MIKHLLCGRMLMMLMALLIAGFSGAIAQKIPTPIIQSAQAVLSSDTKSYDVFVQWTMDSENPLPDGFTLTSKQKDKGGNTLEIRAVDIQRQQATRNTTVYAYTFRLGLKEGHYVLNMFARYSNFGSDSSVGRTIDIGTVNNIRYEFASATTVRSGLYMSTYKALFRISTDDGVTWYDGLLPGWRIQEDFTGNIDTYTSYHSFNQQTGEFVYQPSKPGSFQGYFTLIDDKENRLTTIPIQVKFRIIDCPSPSITGFYGSVTDEQGNKVNGGYVIALANGGKANDDSVVIGKITNGYYEIIYVNPDNYRLYCTGYGYLPEYNGGVRDFNEAELIPIKCGDTARVDFVLEKENIPNVYKVKGMVNDAVTQAPIPHALVSIMSVSRDPINRIVVNAITDEKGLYTTGVPEGEYIVVCNAGRQNAARCYVEQYYRNTTDRTQATIVKVDSDQDGINFSLTECSQENNSVAGIVTDSKNMPISSSVVAFRLPEGKEGLADMVIRSTAAQDGNFMFEKLKAGNYLFFAFPSGVAAIPGFYKANDFATLEWQKATIVKVTPNSTSQIVIKLRDLRSMMGKGGIKGWVRKDGGSMKSDNVQGAEPVKGAIAYAIDENGEVRDFGLTNEDGLFEMSTLNKGKYNLHIERVGYEPSVSEVILEDNNSVKEVTKTLSSSITSGVEDNQQYSHSSVSPNPATNSVKVQYQSDKAETATITVYDVMGETVLIGTHLSQIGTNETALDISKLSAGEYYVRIVTSQDVKTLPLVIVR